MGIFELCAPRSPRAQKLTLGFAALPLQGRVRRVGAGVCAGDWGLRRRRAVWIGHLHH